MTLKFRYHWSLKSFSCVVSTLFISYWSSRNIKRIWSYLSTCLPIHYSHLPRVSFMHFFTAITSTSLFFKNIFPWAAPASWGDISRVVASPNSWWVIGDQIDIWPMIHDTQLAWPSKISKKSSLIRTTLIKLDLVPERCIYNKVSNKSS